MGDRRVSFTKANKLTASRESSQATLDGEGIFMGEDLPDAKSPILSSVSYPVRHDRTSSFDAFSLGMESAPGSPNNMNTPIRKTSIDIKSVNPLESEAEALILKALDRQDQQQTLTNTSLFGNISDKSAAIFRSSDSASRHSSGSHVGHPIHRRTKTTENQLAQLSDTLIDLHNGIIDAEELTIPEDLDEDIKEDHVVYADGPAGETFAKTAMLLYRGRNRINSAARPEDFNDDNESKKSSGSAGPSKWSKLRKAISVRKGLGVEDLAVDLSEKDDAPIDSPSNHKKTDSGAVAHGDVELGNVLDTSESSNQNGGDEQNKKKKKRRHHRFNQPQTGVVRDFQIFFSQRRSGLLSYLRFLFVVIVPSVAVAFCLYYWGGTWMRYVEIKF